MTITDSLIQQTFNHDGAVFLTTKAHREFPEYDRIQLGWLLQTLGWSLDNLRLLRRSHLLRTALTLLRFQLESMSEFARRELVACVHSISEADLSLIEMMGDFASGHDTTTAVSNDVVSVRRVSPATRMADLDLSDDTRRRIHESVDDVADALTSVPRVMPLWEDRSIDLPVLAVVEIDQSEWFVVGVRDREKSGSVVVMAYEVGPNRGAWYIKSTSFFVDEAGERDIRVTRPMGVRVRDLLSRDELARASREQDSPPIPWYARDAVGLTRQSTENKLHMELRERFTILGKLLDHVVLGDALTEEEWNEALVSGGRLCEPFVSHWTEDNDE